MSRKKTDIDAGVLVAAVRGKANVVAKAMQILDDSSREFVSSSLLKLEVLPKALYEKRQAEKEVVANTPPPWQYRPVGKLLTNGQTANSKTLLSA
jgi:hypothetical protein